MKLSIEIIDHKQDEEVIVRCHEPSSDWVDYIKCIQDERNELTGTREGKIYRLKLKDVYYFEVVDSKSFIYYEDEVYESRFRLYEFEEKCRGTVLFRASKSMILNADKIDYIVPSISGRFEAVLLNGEKVIVSRQYVSVLKRMIGL